MSWLRFGTDGQAAAKKASRAMERSEASSAIDDIQNVFEFARRYRLPQREKNRLLMLFGPAASGRDLLADARRHQLIG
jgi:hypothetical protein